MFFVNMFMAKRFVNETSYFIGMINLFYETVRSTSADAGSTTNVSTCLEVKRTGQANDSFLPFDIQNFYT